MGSPLKVSIDSACYIGTDSVSNVRWKATHLFASRRTQQRLLAKRFGLSSSSIGTQLIEGPNSKKTKRETHIESSKLHARFYARIELRIVMSDKCVSDTLPPVFGHVDCSAEANADETEAEEAEGSGT